MTKYYLDCMRTSTSWVRVVFAGTKEQATGTMMRLFQLEKYQDVILRTTDKVAINSAQDVIAENMNHCPMEGGWCLWDEEL